MCARRRLRLLQGGILLLLSVLLLQGCQQQDYTAAPGDEQTAAPAPPTVETAPAEPAPSTTEPSAAPTPAEAAGDAAAAPTATPADAGAAPEKPADAATADAQAAKTEAPAGTPLEIKVPLGLPPVPVPADNPMTEEKVALGRMLYFDKRVSKDGTISCATCHDPKMAWTEHKPNSDGIGGKVGNRNSPTVINAAYADSQFWDGRAKTLEEQAVGPVGNPIEMGNTMEAVVHAFQAVPEYREQFKKVFGTDVTEDGFAKAVAAFERTILSGNSPYDKFEAGDKTALNEAQQRGRELFESVGCDTCHTPPLFSNWRFYNAGIGMDKTPPDDGRRSVTKNDSDMGKFRVAPLREVANTGPYFHDGSAKTLEDAVAVMASGGKDNPNLAIQLKGIREAKVTAEQQKDIVEFLKALSGEYPVVEPPANQPAAP